jgi:hypothetical protein
MEIKSVVTLHVTFAEAPRTIRQDLPRPLIAASEQGEPIDFCTVEIELFWHPEQINNSLKLRMPPRPVVPLETALAEMPRLRSDQSWDGISGLAATAADTARVIQDFQVLQLVAVAPEGVHCLSMRSSGHAAGGVYRVALWVGDPLNANVRLTTRDAVDPATGKATNETDIKIDLQSLALIEADGDVPHWGAERKTDSWRKIWVDLTSLDGTITVALFFLETGSNFHVFSPKAQRMLFGGFDIARLQ